jgi:Galactose oxidase, central domain
MDAMKGTNLISAAFLALIAPVIGGLSVGAASAQSMGTFVSTGDMTTPRFSHTATLLKDGRVLITGGSSVDIRDCLKSAELYDPATGTFTETGDLLYARTVHKAILLPDGRVFIVGGCYPSQISAEVYDPATGTSTGLGEIPGGGRASRLLCSRTEECC